MYVKKNATFMVLHANVILVRIDLWSNAFKFHHFLSFLRAHPQKHLHSWNETISHMAFPIFLSLCSLFVYLWKSKMAFICAQNSQIDLDPRRKSKNYIFFLSSSHLISHSNQREKKIHFDDKSRRKSVDIHLFSWLT